MGQMSLMHMLLLFGIILLFFGGRRLPEVGSSLGKAIREFKDALAGKDDERPERDVTRRESLEPGKSTTAESAKQKDTTSG